MIERLEITQRFNFKKSNKHYECFIIDLVNGNAYFNISEMIYPDQYFEGNLSTEDSFALILNDLKSRVTSRIFHLDEKSRESFKNDFMELDLFNDFEGESFRYFEKLENVYSCNVNVYYSDKYEECCIKNDFPLRWLEFSDLLIRMFNFDVLNVGHLENIVTGLFFDIESDGVYRGEKLDLISLEFGHYESDTLPHSNFIIDFNAGNISGYLEEENIDSELILSLLSEYDVYQWIFKDYHKKSENHDSVILDGYDWYLELIFEDSVIWNLSGHNEYPDSYPALASKIREMTSFDLLELESIPEDEIELFNNYAKKS